MDIEKEIIKIDELLKNMKDMTTGPEYKPNDLLINGYDLNNIKKASIKQLEIKKQEYINLKNKK